MADISDVLIRLLERTEQGKVAWQPTSEDQTFIAIFGSLSVMILVDSVGDPVLRVLNISGDEIEVLDGGVERNRGKQHREELFALHHMARRISLGVDQQLDQLLLELDKDELDDLPF